MKTPRDILLAKHQAAASKLDAIRQEIVVGLNNKETKEQSFFNGSSLLINCLKDIWCELILPSRRIWTGLAAIWILILAINFSTRDHSPATMAKVMPAPPMIVALRQQQQLMSELFNPSDVPVAEPQKPYSPRPGSERRLEITTT